MPKARLTSRTLPPKFSLCLPNLTTASQGRASGRFLYPSPPSPGISPGLWLLPEPLLPCQPLGGSGPRKAKLTANVAFLASPKAPPFSPRSVPILTPTPGPSRQRVSPSRPDGAHRCRLVVLYPGAQGPGGGGEKDPGVKRPSLKRRGQGRTARNRTSPRRGGMEGGGPAAVTPRRGAGGQEAPPGSLFRAAPRLTTAARGALPAQRGPFPVEGLDGSSGPPPLVSTSSPTVEFLSAPTPYLTAGRQSDNLSPATAPWDL